MTYCIHDVDGDEGPDAVSNVVATVVEGGKAGGADLKRSKDVPHLLVLLPPLPATCPFDRFFVPAPLPSP